MPAARTVVLDSVLDPTQRNCLNRTVPPPMQSHEVTRSVGVFLPVQNLTDEFLISENNCRGGGNVQLFLEHFSCSAPMAQLVLLLSHKEALTPDEWCSSHSRVLVSHRGAEAIIMPTYEFLCEKCHKMFDVVWSLAEYDKQIKAKHKCPACGSTRVVKTLSMVQVKTSKKS